MVSSTNSASSSLLLDAKERVRGSLMGGSPTAEAFSLDARAFFFGGSAGGWSKAEELMAGASAEEE